MTAIIRAATSADADGLGRMHHASWVEAYSPLLPAAFWDGYLVETRIEGWRRVLGQPSDPGWNLVVADDGGRIVGHAGAGAARDGEGGAYPAVRDRELTTLYVLASEYGTGLGTRLLEAVLPPATPAQLWVLEGNARARAFYARNGFAADGTRHVFGAEFGHLPEVRMVR